MLTAVLGKDVSLESRATDTRVVTPAQDAMDTDNESPVVKLGWILERNCLALKMSAVVCLCIFT